MSAAPMLALPAFVPVPLRSGSYTITRELDARIRAAAGSPPGDGRHAHPIFAFVAAVGGLGTSIAEICALCDSSIDAGPVLASCTIDYGQPLAFDRCYDVTGAIISRIAKPSRRFGFADHVTLQIRVGNAKSADAEVRLTWIMPRARPS